MDDETLAEAKKYFAEALPKAKTEDLREIRNLLNTELQAREQAGRKPIWRVESDPCQGVRCFPHSDWLAARAYAVDCLLAVGPGTSVEVMLYLDFALEQELPRLFARGQ